MFCKNCGNGVHKEAEICLECGSKIKRKNGLGIAAIVLGIIALLGCWVPFFNIFFIIEAVIGIILGFCSFINTLRKKNNSIVLPIIGMILGVLAFSIGVSINNKVSDNLKETSESNTASKNSSKEENTRTVSKENYDKVKKGMSKKEVFNLLNEPLFSTESEIDGLGKYEYCHYQEAFSLKSITITFKNEKVETKAYTNASIK